MDAEQINMESTINTDTVDYSEIFKDNTQAFEKLFKDYYNPLCNYCQGIVADKQASEDIVQDAFVYLWNNRKTIKIKTTIKTYIYSSVRHGALHYLKKQLMEQTHFPRLVEFITYIQESDYSEEELTKLEDARKILRGLPEQCRTVFLMNCIDGKKYKEIAEELNISVNTVKTHLSKAYRKFREKFDGKSLLVLLISRFLEKR